MLLGIYPTTTLKGLSRETVENIVISRCKYYNFSYHSLMILLLEEESSMGQDRTCGDNGKSCGIYQIRASTWLEFQRITGRYDLNHESDIDQIDMTILALREGCWKKWGPLFRKYTSNPIQ